MGIAAAMNDHDLMRVARTLEAELMADMAAGVRMTQAHLGKIELMTMCTDELVRRGYVRGINPRTMPRDVHYEVVGGEYHRLSFSIRCY